MNTETLNLIGAITSIWAIVITLVTLIIESRQNRMALGVNVLRDLEKDFDSDLYREQRYKLAKFLLERESRGESRKMLPIYMTNVPDFFDSIGLYVNKGIIDTEFAHVTFAYWLERYGCLLTDDIRHLENDLNGVYWKNYETLLREFTKISRRKSKGKEKLSKDDLFDFLNEEIQVCGPRKEIKKIKTKATEPA